MSVGQIVFGLKTCYLQNFKLPFKIFSLSPCDKDEIFADKDLDWHSLNFLRLAYDHS